MDTYVNVGPIELQFTTRTFGVGFVLSPLLKFELLVIQTHNWWPLRFYFSLELEYGYLGVFFNLYEMTIHTYYNLLMCRPAYWSWDKVLISAHSLADMYSSFSYLYQQALVVLIIKWLFFNCGLSRLVHFSLTKLLLRLPLAVAEPPRRQLRAWGVSDRWQHSCKAKGTERRGEPVWQPLRSWPFKGTLSDTLTRPRRAEEKGCERGLRWKSGISLAMPRWSSFDWNHGMCGWSCAHTHTHAHAVLTLMCLKCYIWMVCCHCDSLIDLAGNFAVY